MEFATISEVLAICYLDLLFPYNENCLISYSKEDGMNDIF